MNDPVPYAGLTVVETPTEPFHIREEVREVLQLVEETVVAAMKDLPVKERRQITKVLREALAEATELLVADESRDERHEVAGATETGGAA